MSKHRDGPRVSATLRAGQWQMVLQMMKMGIAVKDEVMRVGSVPAGTRQRVVSALKTVRLDLRDQLSEKAPVREWLMGLAKKTARRVKATMIGHADREGLWSRWSTRAGS